MNQQNMIIGGVVILVLVGALIFYQQSQARAAAAAYARTPGALLGSGVGNLISGIAGFATGGGGAA